MAWVGFLMFWVVVRTAGRLPGGFCLAGTALIFALVGTLAGVFDPVFLDTMPNRIFGIMSNVTLIAVPLFVFMGVTLERARIAEDLLETLSMLMGRLRGGLGIAVILVGMLMAASTGIVGATVITMGLLSLPTMLKARLRSRGRDRHDYGCRHPRANYPAIHHPGVARRCTVVRLSAGAAQPGYLSARDGVSRRSFYGALFPGLLLVVMYIAYLLVTAWLKPASMPAWQTEGSKTLQQAN